MNKSKGAIEADISKALTQWEKDFLGRGSITVKADILRDMIIVQLSGILSPAEYLVCETKEGILSIKRTRSKLIESGMEDLKQIILNITGEEVISFHSDLSTLTGERVMIFKLATNYEKSFVK